MSLRLQTAHGFLSALDFLAPDARALAREQSQRENARLIMQATVTASASLAAAIFAGPGDSYRASRCACTRRAPAASIGSRQQRLLTEDRPPSPECFPGAALAQSSGCLPIAVGPKEVECSN